MVEEVEYEVEVIGEEDINNVFVLILRNVQLVQLDVIRRKLDEGDVFGVVD